MASCVWPCAWSCALWPVGESTRESGSHLSAKTRPYWLKRAVIRHTPRRENLIYALLVAVVVRGIRAARVRAILVLRIRVVVRLVAVVVRGIRAALWAILLLRRMSVVVRLVRVVVRRVRAGRVRAGLLLLVLGIVRM